MFFDIVDFLGLGLGFGSSSSSDNRPAKGSSSSNSERFQCQLLQKCSYSKQSSGVLQYGNSINLITKVQVIKVKKRFQNKYCSIKMDVSFPISNPNNIVTYLQNQTFSWVFSLPLPLQNLAWKLLFLKIRQLKVKF